MRMRIINLVFLLAVVASNCSLIWTENDESQFSDLKDKWQRLSDNVDVDEVPPPKSARNYEDQTNLPPTSDSKVNGPVVTATLISWISSQCEKMIEEIEAIADQNAVATKFSPVNYLRYLFLYERLKALIKQSYPELKWIKQKVNIFGSVYKQSIQYLRVYLEDQNVKLMKIEDSEPKGKQKAPSREWLEHYQNIRYIAVHAPEASELAKRAIELLAYSPDNNPLRMRSARYEVKTRAFSR